MKRSTSELIIDYFNEMLKATVDAQNFVLNMSRTEFLNDTKTINAVTRCLELISQKASAIRRLDHSKHYDNLPWKEMIGMNRKITHLYQEIDPCMLWQTVKEDLHDVERHIRAILGENISDLIPKHQTKYNRLKLTSNENILLTPTTLTVDLTPYLLALSRLQNIIDFSRGEMSQPIKVKSINQNSPISVSLDGAAEATEVVRDIVVPWRREHAKSLAQLEEQNQLVHIESTKADVQEKRARAQKERSEAKRIESEINPEKTRIEIEQMRLENEKLRLEIEESRINLALKILDKLSPELSEGQRILYAMQLLQPLGILTETPLLLTSDSEE